MLPNVEIGLLAVFLVWRVSALELCAASAFRLNVAFLVES